MYWLYGGLNGDDFYTGQDDDSTNYSWNRGSTYVPFVKNPLYYFSKIPKHVKELRRTDKAVLLKWNVAEVWFPKKIIRVSKGETYVHTDIAIKLIQEKVQHDKMDIRRRGNWGTKK